uniref:Rad4 domain-containing protein n=1 Tax=Caenorhabditis japonica TaxID=281687 RepID=A0A8R1HNG2_CAEJA
MQTRRSERLKNAVKPAVVDDPEPPEKTGGGKQKRKQKRGAPSKAEDDTEMNGDQDESKPKQAKKQAQTKKRARTPIEEFSSSSSSEYDSDGSDFEVHEEKKSPMERKKLVTAPKRKKNNEEKDVGDVNWPKCRPASIARKTGNPRGSKVVKSGLRMAGKTKPDQPWKKNTVNYDADRKLAKGERRMKEYRNVAEFCARGRVGEISYDECYKIHQDMKTAYMQGQKIIQAVDKQSTESNVPEKDDSSSDDEWEEMEQFHPVLDEQIEVNMNDDEEVEKDWWVVYLRQEINKRVRMSWENTHKVHLLCFMAHLKYVVKTVLDEGLIPSMMISCVPSGYLKYVGEDVPPDVMLKLVKWFCDSFRPNEASMVTNSEDYATEGSEARFAATRRMTTLVGLSSYETDLDRASLLFCLLRGMELTARICVNVRAISRKWDTQQEEGKLENKEKTVETKAGAKKRSSSDRSTSKGKSNKHNQDDRNYWVEYWNLKEKRWICIDPLHKTVDSPLSIHEDATSPISYVFAIDNSQRPAAPRVLLLDVFLLFFVIVRFDIAVSTKSWYRTTDDSCSPIW